MFQPAATSEHRVHAGHLRGEQAPLHRVRARAGTGGQGLHQTRTHTADMATPH